MYGSVCIYVSPISQGTWNMARTGYSISLLKVLQKCKKGKTSLHSVSLYIINKGEILKKES